MDFFCYFVILHLLKVDGEESDLVRERNTHKVSVEGDARGRGKQREKKGESEGERGRRRLEKLKERGVGCARERYTH